MKTWIFALLVILLGAVIGVAWTVSQLGFSADVMLPSGKSSNPAMVKPDDSAQANHSGVPKIVVDQEVYDFGTMDSQSEQKHDFVIRNEGTAPLEIENKGTSCKCTVSNFQKRTVSPGESTKIALTWTAKTYYGPYSQTATIATNDPEHPKVTLQVKGRVTAHVRAIPPDVIFNSISAGRVTRSTVRLYSYKTKAFEISEIQLSNPDTAKFFKITPRQLNSEEISQEEDAQSGYELEIEVKPGLPLGRFHQTIRVHTNLPKVPVVEIPVRGQVIGDITIVGRGWDSDQQRLRLGMLARGAEADYTLLLVVKGRYRNTIDFEIAEVFPSELVTAELGEATHSGLTARVPLKIHISKDGGPANYLGTKQSPSGRILLHTNHPQAPRITIPISFAVEGG